MRRCTAFLDMEAFIFHKSQSEVISGASFIVKRCLRTQPHAWPALVGHDFNELRHNENDAALDFARL